MKYNFDKLTDRASTNSVKWDKIPGVLPMWIADMDFEVAPCIVEAIKRKAEERIFGYTLIPDSYRNAVSDWFSRRHGWKIEKEWIDVVYGIVPAIAICVEAFTKPGEKVLVQTPTYNCFFNAIDNLGRKVWANELVYSDGNRYSIDYEDLEQKCSDPDCKLFLLCNPQNPAGRIWTPDELGRMAEIAKRNGVIVISDEIHCELEMPGHKYTPFGTLPDEYTSNSVTFCSPTKGFNIAGLHIANIVTKEASLREKVEEVIRRWQHSDINQIGVVALEAAYSNEGEDWLEELNNYLWGNYCALKEKFESELPDFNVTELEATYLVWLDCRSLQNLYSSHQISDSLLENEKVWVNDGEMYGGEGFLRINIACPRERLMDGVERIIRGLRRLSE